MLKSIAEFENMDELIKLKERIKDEIIKPMDWKMRMDLYKEIQLINQQLVSIINKH